MFRTIPVVAETVVAYDHTGTEYNSVSNLASRTYIAMRMDNAIGADYRSRRYMNLRVNYRLRTYF